MAAQFTPEILSKKSCFAEHHLLLLALLFVFFLLRFFFPILVFCHGLLLVLVLIFNRDDSTVLKLLRKPDKFTKNLF